VQEVDDLFVAALGDQIVDVVAKVGEATVQAFDPGKLGFVGDDPFETFGVVGHRMRFDWEDEGGGRERTRPAKKAVRRVPCKVECEEGRK
jgi:hypothetical protein